MQIDNEFTVSVPIEQAWAVLTDLAGIAPCMPGAQLTGVEGDVYSGRVKVKVGPVTSEYAGTAQFAEKDDAAYRAVIDAKGRDARGAGNASALITAHLRPEGDGTVVTVNTDLRLSGRIAQFGSGMIKEVSAKLLGQFVTCLEAKLTGPAEGPAAAAATASAAGTAPAPAAAAADAGSAAAGPAPAGAGTGTSPAPAVAAPQETAAAGAQHPHEHHVLDLMSIAGASIYKRLIPLVVVLLVIIGLILYFTLR
jgi:carbon monoxide dehydrogenase subunit G